MNRQEFTDWLTSCSTAGKIRVLATIYGALTISARELFLPGAAGHEKRVIEILHGLNEVHHTLANSLVAYATDETKAFPVQTLSQQLTEIESQYHLEKFVSSALTAVRGYH